MTADYLILWLCKDQSKIVGNVEDMEVSNPVEITEYVIAYIIVEESVFNWWVPLTQINPR